MWHMCFFRQIKMILIIWTISLSTVYIMKYNIMIINGDDQMMYLFVHWKILFVIYIGMEFRQGLFIYLYLFYYDRRLLMNPLIGQGRYIILYFDYNTYIILCYIRVIEVYTENKVHCLTQFYTYHFLIII